MVVATGPFQVPFIPPRADALDPGVHQIHSAQYRHPQSVPPGKVLVVGAANSGCQIAQELSATHRVELAAGRRIPAIPQRPLGRDVWAWATALRLDKVTADSRLGQRLAGRDQVIGPGPRRLARRHGIRIRPRAASAAGKTVTFADGSAAEFDAVVWATGFTADHSWIDIPEAKDDRGNIRHQRGVTPSPACTCSAAPGSTPAAPHCSAGSAVTRRSWPRRSAVGARMKERTGGGSRLGWLSWKDCVLAPAMTHTPGATLTPQRDQSIRAPVLWGLAFGAIQAASPLALRWLDQAAGPGSSASPDRGGLHRVRSGRRKAQGDRCRVHHRWRVRFASPRASPDRPGSWSLAIRAMVSKTSGRSAATTLPTHDGGPPSAPPSIGSSPSFSPSRSLQAPDFITSQATGPAADPA